VNDVVSGKRFNPMEKERPKSRRGVRKSYGMRKELEGGGRGGSSVTGNSCERKL